MLAPKRISFSRSAMYGRVSWGMGCTRLAVMGL